MLCRTLIISLLAPALASCASLPPPVYGSIELVSRQDTQEAFAAARRDLARSVLDYHLFRLWIQWHDEIYVYYRSHEGPARHLVVKRIAGRWQVTDRPQAIDRDPEDVIVTW